MAAMVQVALAVCVKVTVPAVNVLPGVWGTLALNNPKVTPATSVVAAPNAVNAPAATSNRFLDSFIYLLLYDLDS
jgi:hypothetical protein